MSQNTSSAVMQQRVEPSDSLDFFPTPPWATRALCERLKQGAPIWGQISDQSVWEPACGHGDMARPLVEYFNCVIASDVCDRSDVFSWQSSVQDFLIDWLDMPSFKNGPPEWVITNPPFRLAREFVETALRRSSVGCAMLVRTAFLETQERYELLFKDNPPNLILQFSERVPMFKGRLDPKGSTATAYCWLVWVHDGGDLRAQMEWIAPCRKQLEFPEDYTRSGSVS